MNQEMKRSHFLFARPTFWRGWAEIWDFANTLSLYNASPTVEQADYYATKSDWMAVGDDLRRALNRYAQVR